MELQHISHEHVLILLDKEEQKKGYDGVELVCRACKRTILGPSYCCKECNFFLHESCALLPREIKHPLHTAHTLTLRPDNKFTPNRNYICDACDKRCRGFTYRCSICDFDLDMTCASSPPLRRIMQHQGHNHPLTLVRPASFTCDACGTKHEEDMSYFCSICDFWVHQHCVSLPTTVRHTAHAHPLTLIYSVPPEYSKFKFNCDICSEEMENYHWLYWCDRCRFFAHLSCATSRTTLKSPPVRNDPTEAQPENVGRRQIQVPVPDYSLLMTHIFKQISLEKRSTATELKHFSHKHPLTFSEKTCPGYQFCPSQSVEDYEICNACAMPISDAFYACLGCKFFLHECCAFLPKVIQNPSHKCESEGMLTLFPKVPNFVIGKFFCFACRSLDSYFCYSCKECGYNLDVICGSLGNSMDSLGHSLKHDAHEHPLVFVDDGVEFGCKACLGRFKGCAYGCGTCKFFIHIQCALLPAKAVHRHHKHPLTLTFQPVEIQPDEYVCDDCEEEINPRTWFYHCVDCDSSAHAGCIFHRANWKLDARIGE